MKELYVSAGYAHALCLDIYGNVFSFGSNGSGQFCWIINIQFMKKTE